MQRWLRQQRQRAPPCRLQHAYLQPRYCWQRPIAGTATLRGARTCACRLPWPRQCMPTWQTGRAAVLGQVLHLATKELVAALQHGLSLQLESRLQVPARGCRHHPMASEDHAERQRRRLQSAVAEPRAMMTMMMAMAMMMTTKL